MTVFTKKGRKYAATGRLLYGPPNNTVFAGFGVRCGVSHHRDSVLPYDELARPTRWDRTIVTSHIEDSTSPLGDSLNTKACGRIPASTCRTCTQQRQKLPVVSDAIGCDRRPSLRRSQALAQERLRPGRSLRPSPELPVWRPGSARRSRLRWRHKRKVARHRQNTHRTRTVPWQNKRVYAALLGAPGFGEARHAPKCSVVDVGAGEPGMTSGPTRATNTVSQLD